MKTISRYHLGLFILVVFLMLIIGFLIGLNFQKMLLVTPTIKNTAAETLNGTCKIKADFTALNIQNFITYKIPDGFRQTVGGYDERLNCGDMIYNHYLNLKGSDMGIQIEMTMADPRVQTADLVDGKMQNTSNITSIKIDNIDAVRFHYDDINQGHFLEYLIPVDLYRFNIWIQTKDLKTEESNQTLINNFIDSIVFTNN